MKLITLLFALFLGCYAVKSEKHVLCNPEHVKDCKSPLEAWTPLSSKDGNCDGECKCPCNVCQARNQEGKCVSLMFKCRDIDRCPPGTHLVKADLVHGPCCSKCVNASTLCVNAWCNGDPTYNNRTEYLWKPVSSEDGDCCGEVKKICREHGDWKKDEYRKKEHRHREKYDYEHKEKYGKRSYEDKEDYGKKSYEDKEDYGKKSYEDKEDYNKKSYEDKEEYGKKSYEDKEDYNKKSYDREDKEEYGKKSYEDKEGYNKKSYEDKEGYNKKSYEDKEDYSKKSYDREDKEEYGEKKSYDREDKEEYGKKSYEDKEDYNKKSYDREDKEEYGENRKSYDREDKEEYGENRKSYDHEQKQRDRHIEVCLTRRDHLRSQGYSHRECQLGYENCLQEQYLPFPEFLPPCGLCEQRDEESLECVSVVTCTPVICDRTQVLVLANLTTGPCCDRCDSLPLIVPKCRRPCSTSGVNCTLVNETQLPCSEGFELFIPQTYRSDNRECCGVCRPVCEACHTRNREGKCEPNNCTRIKSCPLDEYLVLGNRSDSERCCDSCQTCDGLPDPNTTCAGDAFLVLDKTSTNENASCFGKCVCPKCHKQKRCKCGDTFHLASPNVTCCDHCTKGQDCRGVRPVDPVCNASQIL